MLLTRKAVKAAGFFLFLGEPARLRGRCFQASQTHINGPTPGNVASSRRAVGLSAPMFLASIIVRAYAIRPYEHHMYGRVAYALMPKTFPLQSLSHARPRHHHVSRRTIQSPRPHLDPSPRTPRSGLLSKKKGTSPATGYRHATANAVGARVRVCSPATATTTARIDSVYVAI